MLKKTILCAQYRLPHPVYWSGADISNLVFLNALSLKWFVVETLFVTVKQEPLEWIKLLLEKNDFNSCEYNGKIVLHNRYDNYKNHDFID